MKKDLIRDKEFEEQLKIAEGYREDPYQDTKGLWTGGYGHLIAQKEWPGISLLTTSSEKRDYWEGKFLEDLQEAQGIVDFATKDWSYQPNQTQYEVLVEMAFNLGVRGFFGFKNFLGFFSKGYIREASKEIINSKYHRDFVTWNSGKDTPQIRSRKLEKKLLDSTKKRK